MAKALRRTDIVQQQPPQSRLPALVGGQRSAAGTQRIVQFVATVLPVVQPVGAIDLVLVEQVGDTGGQLMALSPVRIVAEEIAQRSERLLVQRVAGISRISRQTSRDLSNGEVAGTASRPSTARYAVHRKRAGSCDLDGGAIPSPPLAGARASASFNHCAMPLLCTSISSFSSGAQRCARQPGGQQVAQVLKPVAVQHHQAGFDRDGARG